MLKKRGVITLNIYNNVVGVYTIIDNVFHPDYINLDPITNDIIDNFEAQLKVSIISVYLIDKSNHSIYK